VDWSLLACGRSGHLTYHPDEADLAERLSVITAAGEAWRCLRCGSFVPGAPAHSGPASQAPTLLRGRALRDAVILRLLAVERFVEGLGLLLAAVAVWRWQDWKGDFATLWSRDLPLLQPIAEQFGWDLQHSVIARWAADLVTVNASALTALALGMTAYALLRWVEAVGLWLMRRWGEYLAVVLTSVFLPWEALELAHHPTVVKGLLLLINIAAVIWLVWTKRLFGARGGRAAHEAEHAEVSILAIEREALHSPPP
jgi:uncharacterized membrane protein (DUF2068 family)